MREDLAMEFRVNDFVDVGFGCGTIIRITRARSTNDKVYVIRLFGSTETIIRHDGEVIVAVERPKKVRQ